MSRSSLRLAQILCPTDFSVFSARAFRHALVLARRFGARVKVVHMLPFITVPPLGARLPRDLVTAMAEVPGAR